MDSAGSIPWFFLRLSLLRSFGRPARRLDPELLRVLGDETLPAELRRFAADDPPNRLTRELPLEDVEADVPAGGAPGDEAAIDVVPQLEARAATERLELPPEIVAAPAVLEQSRSLGSLHGALGDLGCRRPDRRELHGPHGGQVSVGVERCPLGQLRGIRQRLPHHLRRMAKLSDEDERPRVAALLNLGSRRRAGHVLLAVAHRLFPFFGVFAIRSRWRSSAST